MVEIVIALGVFSFAVLAILGLFAAGLQTSRESEQEIQAASTAAMLVEVRRAAPRAELADFAISADALVQPYGPAWPGGATNFIGSDGYLTTAAAAAYRITCLAGTTATTGPAVAQMYILLSWPPETEVSAPQAGRYEIIAHIPNQ